MAVTDVAAFVSCGVGRPTKRIGPDGKPAGLQEERGFLGRDSLPDDVALSSQLIKSDGVTTVIDVGECGLETAGKSGGGVCSCRVPPDPSFAGLLASYVVRRRRLGMGGFPTPIGRIFLCDLHFFSFFFSRWACLAGAENRRFCDSFRRTRRWLCGDRAARHDLC